jgi:hypothetical protein
MRLACTTLIAFAFLSALAADRAFSAAPTDQDVIALGGARMARVFAKFGTPADMFVVDAGTDSASVCLDYGSFGYFIRNKSATTVLFWQDWTGGACGVSMGDTADAIAQKLGKADNVSKRDGGGQFMYWDYKANDEVMRLQITIGPDNKCSRIVLTLK